nr:reverse transcriptase domain-containing protein [Tanacetum cinerariifolium]
NALNVNDQDSLNSAAGGNFLEKMPRGCLKIIESKSKNQCQNIQNLQSQMATLTEMMSKFVNANTASSSGSGTLPDITTRSGVAYDRPKIPPTPSPLPKIVECEIEATKDKVQATSSKNTAHVQPLVVQVPILKPDVSPKTNPKPLHFDINFADALLNMLQLASMFKSLQHSSTSGNPTLLDPIIASSSASFTPFEGSEFILEGLETFLRTLDELNNLSDDYYDTEGYILYFEKLLNEDPSPNLPPMKNKDLKQVDATMTKPSIEEPLELELKDLPSHLEYAFLE